MQDIAVTERRAAELYDAMAAEREATTPDHAQHLRDMSAHAQACADGEQPGG